MKNDGGPAFPIPSPEMTSKGQTVYETQGMKLRDYFAAAALQGFIAAMPHMSNLQTHDDSPLNEKAISAQAFAFADAMLKERSKDA